MEWQEPGIVIFSRPHGERGRIVELLTASHGRHGGMVRGQQQSGGVCQLGNLVQASWKARLEEHMGNYAVELLYPHATSMLRRPVALAALQAICAILRACLPDREPAPEVFDGLGALLGQMREGEKLTWLTEYVRFELMLLQWLGFGLDVFSCADTGGQAELCYLSPRTGRAVCAKSGAPYHEKLLLLPPYLRPGADPTHRAIATEEAEIAQGLAITQLFLEKYALAPQNANTPGARAHLAALLAKDSV